MSFVIAAPEALVAVASDLAGIGSALAEANAAALAPTTALLAAGADEVSRRCLARTGRRIRRLAPRRRRFMPSLCRR